MGNPEKKVLGQNAPSLLEEETQPGPALLLHISGTVVVLLVLGVSCTAVYREGKSCLQRVLMRGASAKREPFRFVDSRLAPSSLIPHRSSLIPQRPDIIRRT